MEKLIDFIKMSNFAGQRQDLVQAGGGNSSVKLTNKRMLIKASGFQLADLTLNSGYAEVDHSIISNYFHETPLKNICHDMEKKLLDLAYIQGSRPSIETFLHSITDTFTLHTHPIVVNVLTMRHGGMAVLESLFPGALMVEYHKPGIELAKAYFSCYLVKKRYQFEIFDIIFLKNHGLIVSGKSSSDVIDKTEKILKRIESFLKIDMSAFHYTSFLREYLLSIYETGVVWMVTDKFVLEAFEEQENNCVWDYQFCPDCLVYCGKQPLIIKDGDIINQIKHHIHLFGKPVVIVYKCNMYIYALNMKKALEIQSVLSFSAQVHRLNKDFKYDLLSEKEQDTLLNWESEQYRQKL